MPTHLVIWLYLAVIVRLCDGDLEHFSSCFLLFSIASLLLSTNCSTYCIVFANTYRRADCCTVLVCGEMHPLGAISVENKGVSQGDIKKMTFRELHGRGVNSDTEEKEYQLG